jgi:hypothetical protein
MLEVEEPIRSVKNARTICGFLGRRHMGRMSTGQLSRYVLHSFDRSVKASFHSDGMIVHLNEARQAGCDDEYAPKWNFNQSPSHPVNR